MLRDGGPARSTISPTPKSLRRHRAINDNRRNHGPKIKIVTMSEAKDLACVFSVVILSDAKDLRLFFSNVILSGARPQLSPAVYELYPREVEWTPRSRMHRSGPRSQRGGESVAQRPNKI
jgi:hypothetical protein